MVLRNIKLLVVVLLVGIQLVACSNSGIESLGGLNDGNIEEIGNIKFKVPKYYDVRHENERSYNIHFYPEREDAHASMGLTLIDKKYSPETIMSSKDGIIKRFEKTYSITDVSDEVKGNNYILKMKIASKKSKGNRAILVNDSTQEAVIVELIVDDDDKTGIDYYSDFDKIIQNAVFRKVKKNGWVMEGKYWYHYNNDRKEQSKFVGDYYVGEDGRMLSNVTKRIRGKYYKFDQDGKHTIVEGLELVGGIDGTSRTYNLDGYSADYITGVVKNNTDKKYSYLQITFDLIDFKGNIIGTALANVNNIGPGETWKFKAMALEDAFFTYRLGEITGW